MLLLRGGGRTLHVPAPAGLLFVCSDHLDALPHWSGFPVETTYFGEATGCSDTFGDAPPVGWRAIRAYTLDGMRLGRAAIVLTSGKGRRNGSLTSPPPTAADSLRQYPSLNRPQRQWS